MDQRFLFYDTVLSLIRSIQEILTRCHDRKPSGRDLPDSWRGQYSSITDPTTTTWLVHVILVLESFIFI